MTWRIHARTSRGHHQPASYLKPMLTSESEMSGASSWQFRPVNEQGKHATKAQPTGEPPVSKHDHGNQRRMADFWTNTDERGRKREGGIYSDGQGTRQGDEWTERNVPPRAVGSSRTIDAAKHDTAQMLAALLQTLLIPSESPVVKAMREVGQQYHEEVQAADAQRRRDLGPPHIHVFAAVLKAARDCLALLKPSSSHG